MRYLRSIIPSLCVSLAIASAAVADPPASTSRDLQRLEATYAIPAVDLVRDDGKTVSLPAELDDGRPVVLNFIYTSCSTICPLSSQVFAQFQRALGAKHESVHLVSISPTPSRIRPRICAPMHSNSTPSEAGIITPARWPPVLRSSEPLARTTAIR